MLARLRTIVARLRRADRAGSPDAPSSAERRAVPRSSVVSARPDRRRRRRTRRDAA